MALTLIVVNGVLFALQMIAMRLDVLTMAGAPLSLVPSQVLGSGWVWQLLTAMGMHSPHGTGHLVGNMFWLWFFASPLEREEGGRVVLRTYLITGLAGNVFWVLLGGFGYLVQDLGLLGQLFLPIWNTPGLGASGAVSGVVFYWLARHYDEVLNFLVIGPIRGRTMMIGMAVLEILTMLSFSEVAWGVHLGGMATGAALGFGWFDLQSLRARSRRRKLESRRRDVERKLSRLEVIEGGRGKKPEDWVN
jgi:membrane associated rhomboid family serine protease